MVISRIIEMGCTTDGIVFLNGDPFASMMPDKWHMFSSQTNLGALGALNRVFRNYPVEPFYGFIGDDEFVNTTNFDQILIKAAGDWNVAHGDDGVNHGRRAQSYLCIGGKLARAVGYLAIPACWHSFGLDDFYETLAQSGGCTKVFCPEVKVTHLHPLHGSALPDDCYKLGASRHDADGYAFQQWKEKELPDVLLRIEEAKRHDASQQA